MKCGFLKNIGYFKREAILNITVLWMPIFLLLVTALFSFFKITGRARILNRPLKAEHINGSNADSLNGKRP